ncbi:MAG: hypothetical protein SPK00_03185 [Corynebacterium glucuronolyticum]|nr:hypothetical protein [Mycobacteriaceae bacterium]MDY5833741.1 hypothetical protein [Corynebacterium glucuronolyticum]
MSNSSPKKNSRDSHLRQFQGATSTEDVALAAPVSPRRGNADRPNEQETQ